MSCILFYYTYTHTTKKSCETEQAKPDWLNGNINKTLWSQFLELDRIMYMQITKIWISYYWKALNTVNESKINKM